MAILIRRRVFAASDLGLHCLLMSHKKNARRKWVKELQYIKCYLSQLEDNNICVILVLSCEKIASPNIEPPASLGSNIMCIRKKSPESSVAVFHQYRTGVKTLVQPLDITQRVNLKKLIVRQASR